MDQAGQSIVVESVPLQEVVESLRGTRPFAETGVETVLHALGGVESVDRITARAGTALLEPGEPWRFYWLVLQGEIRAMRPGAGRITYIGRRCPHRRRFWRGGAPHRQSNRHFSYNGGEGLELIRFAEQEFWALLACCPAARKVVLEDMAQRLRGYQVEEMHREKLVSLGTLAAGLMHELHNPGSAAKRAASQLRENLKRLQELSLALGGEAQDAGPALVHAQPA